MPHTTSPMASVRTSSDDALTRDDAFTHSSAPPRHPSPPLATPRPLSRFRLAPIHRAPLSLSPFPPPPLAALGAAKGILIITNYTLITHYDPLAALGAAFRASFLQGLAMTLTVLIHEVPHEIGDVAILMQAGFTKWQAIKAQLLTALGALLGTLVALAMGEQQSSLLLNFTAGNVRWCSECVLARVCVAGMCARSATSLALLRRQLASSTSPRHPHQAVSSTWRRSTCCPRCCRATAASSRQWPSWLPWARASR